jgi:hypothetical protein
MTPSPGRSRAALIIALACSPLSAIGAAIAAPAVAAGLLTLALSLPVALIVAAAAQSLVASTYPAVAAVAPFLAFGGRDVAALTAAFFAGAVIAAGAIIPGSLISLAITLLWVGVRATATRHATASGRAGP